MRKRLWIIWLAIAPLSGMAQQLSVKTAGEMGWILHAAGRNVVQTAYRVLVADNPAFLNGWDSKKVTSDISIHVPYRGVPLLAGKTYYWKVMVWDNQGHVSAWSATDSLQTELVDWKGAAWIAYAKLSDTSLLIPGGKRLKKGERVPNDVLPLFRKTFVVKGPVKKATAFVCGLGQFEFSVNGTKAGDHFLDPGWTRFDKEALYVPLDITHYLHPGKNALGIALGNGFLYTPSERYHKLIGVYGYPKVIGLVRVEYRDGTTEDIITDSTWRTAPSPVVFSSIYGGEDYDARLERKGWNTVGFNDASWRKVVYVDGPPLRAQQEPPLKVWETFEGKKVAVSPDASAPGASNTYDLGQNISGIVRIRVRGHRGDTVRIIPGELMHPDGTANQRATGSPYYFTYILKGEGVETWEPQFSYYGFRYLQVETPATLLEIQGLHTSSEGPPVGSFSCSNELFNRINSLIRWSIRNNMASVLTDCPTREKLGWLEQTHLMGNSIQYNYDLSRLYRKMIRDMMTAQTPDGLIPEIAPEYTVFGEPFRDSPEWGSAAILLPWNLYEWYGDSAIVGESYDMMQRYMAYLGTKADHYILTQGLGDWYDIGPAKPGFSQLTPKGLTATAFYYYDAVILGKEAALLGKTQDVQQYADLAGHIRQAFNDTFFNKDSLDYGTGSQTANAMALYLGLVQSPNQGTVMDSLVADIRRHQNGTTAGDIGFHYVLKALEDKPDVIMDMNNQSVTPGYGYQLAKGATALTESWQALPSVSNDHLMLGHLMEFLYACIAGINAGSPAYRTIEIRPTPVSGMTHAEATYACPYGRISSRWRVENGYFLLNVEIPVNTTAVIHLPTGAVPVGSGVYSFKVKMNKP